MRMTVYQQRIAEENIGIVNEVVYGHFWVSSDPSISYEDFYQIGCEALCKAATCYQPEIGPFHPFAYQVIFNGIVDYCRKQKKRDFRSQIMPYDVNNYDLSLLMKSEESDAAYNNVESSSAVHIMRERQKEYTGVSKTGIEAMELKASGYSTVEIANYYGTTRQNVMAWISRARKKLKKDRELMSALCVEMENEK